MMTSMLQLYASYAYFELRFPASFLYYMEPFTNFISYNRYKNAEIYELLMEPLIGKQPERVAQGVVGIEAFINSTSDNIIMNMIFLYVAVIGIIGLIALLALLETYLKKCCFKFVIKPIEFCKMLTTFNTQNTSRDFEQK